MVPGTAFEGAAWGMLLGHGTLWFSWPGAVEAGFPGLWTPVGIASPVLWPCWRTFPADRSCAPGGTTRVRDHRLCGSCVAADDGLVPESTHDCFERGCGGIDR